MRNWIGAGLLGIVLITLLAIGLFAGPNPAEAVPMPPEVLTEVTAEEPAPEVDAANFAARLAAVEATRQRQAVTRYFPVNPAEYPEYDSFGPPSGEYVEVVAEFKPVPPMIPRRGEPLPDIERVHPLNRHCAATAYNLSVQDEALTVDEFRGLMHAQGCAQAEDGGWVDLAYWS